MIEKEAEGSCNLVTVRFIEREEKKKTWVKWVFSDFCYFSAAYKSNT